MIPYEKILCDTGKEELPESTQQDKAYFANISLKLQHLSLNFSQVYLSANHTSLPSTEKSFLKIIQEARFPETFSTRLNVLYTAKMNFLICNLQVEKCVLGLLFLNLETTAHQIFLLFYSFSQSSPHKTVLLRGHIRASRKLGLCRLWSFGIHLSLHIETERVDGVTATHISKQ